MSATLIAKAAGIHVIVPLLGLVAFWRLCRRMRLTAVPAPPVYAFFVLFLNLGGWILVALTAFFWTWSGMASVGAAFLILISPILASAFAMRLISRRKVSPYHKVAFVGNAAYASVMVVFDICVAVMLFSGRNQ